MVGQWGDATRRGDRNRMLTLERTRTIDTLSRNRAGCPRLSDCAVPADGGVRLMAAFGRGDSLDAFELALDYAQRGVMCSDDCPAATPCIDLLEGTRLDLETLEDDRQSTLAAHLAEASRGAA